MNEPIRHHYIPQFILRNFCYNHRRRLYYYDVKRHEGGDRETRDVFMIENLYRDEINCGNQPTKIETDLAKFENEAAQIIERRLLRNREFTMTTEEEDMLKLFFAVMPFRSQCTNRAFGTDSTKESRLFYKKWQHNGDLSDFWKRNLKFIIECRSIKEVINHPDIDDPIKLFMEQDTEGFFGRYFSVAEATEKYEFVISDAYPVIISGILPDGVELPVYSIYPISSKRVLFSVHRGATFTPRTFLSLRECLLREPALTQDGTHAFRVRKIYPEEVQYINRMIVKNATIGVAGRRKAVVNRYVG